MFSKKRPSAKLGELFSPDREFEEFGRMALVNLKISLIKKFANESILTEHSELSECLKSGQIWAVRRN